MNQEIKIERENYCITKQDEISENKLKMDFRNMTFGSYHPWRDYFHIQVGDFDEFNLYINMNPCEAEKLFLELAEKARKLHRGY